MMNTSGTEKGRPLNKQYDTKTWRHEGWDVLVLHDAVSRPWDQSDPITNAPCFFFAGQYLNQHDKLRKRAVQLIVVLTMLEGGLCVTPARGWPQRRDQQTDGRGVWLVRPKCKSGSSCRNRQKRYLRRERQRGAGPGTVDAPGRGVALVCLCSA